MRMEYDSYVFDSEHGIKNMPLKTLMSDLLIFISVYLFSGALIMLSLTYDECRHDCFILGLIIALLTTCIYIMKTALTFSRKMI